MEISQQPHSELLAELSESLYEQPASVGQRFLNYLIDIIFFYIIVIALTAVAVISFGEFILQEDNSTGMSALLQYLISYTIYVATYTFFETVTNGRTIGKMVTKTRAVKLDGSAISFNDALKRSLVRIIPVEAFSAFGGNPWHDRWTDTKVIREVN
jgi:uncharacterized RDD family membrane protein YckC